MSIMAQVDIVRAACCLAAIDGRIGQRELGVIRRLAAKVGLGEASLSAILDRARTDTDFYQQQFNVLQADAKTTVKLLFAVAVVDGQLRQEERILLHHFAMKLGMTQEEFDRILTAAEMAIEAVRKQPDESKEMK